jgi:tetratricopeptide (TPR) repeat protein
MNKLMLFFAVMTAAFSFSASAYAGDKPASKVINVFEDKAFKDATAGLKPDGRNMVAAAINMRMGQYKQAIPLLEQLATKYNKPALWNLLAFSYNRTGSWKEAYDASNASIKLEPSGRFSYGERGIAEYQLGKIKEAEMDLAKHLKTEGGDGAAHYYHGLALARMGRLTAARGSFVLAKLRRPLLKTFAEYNIALIDARQGHVKEALKPMKEIYAAFKADDNYFSHGLENDVARLEKVEAVRQRSLAAKSAILAADARHAGPPPKLAEVK